MLAYDWIEFLDLHLVRHGALVFVSSVIVTGVCAGNQFNLVSHLKVLFLVSVAGLNLVAFLADISQYTVDAKFVDDAHTFG